MTSSTPLLAAALLTVSVAASLSGCGKDDVGAQPGTPAARGVVAFPRGLPPEQADEGTRGPLRFVDATRRAGIDIRPRSGSDEKLLIPENIGHGAMFFDYDEDGDLDIYIANGGDLERPGAPEFPNTLWRNLGDGRFEDVTEGSGLSCPEWTCGVYAVDYDADGWRDVFVTQLGKNRMFRNLEGSGRFEDVTDATGVGDEGWGCSAAFFDADGDGDLDLYVGNYVDFDVRHPPNDGVPCEWRNLKVCCGPRGLPEARDVFYENVGGRFEVATERFGFHNPDRQGRPQGSFSLGVVAADFDDDGDQDLYVAVDSRPNLMFENLGGGRFREVAHDWQLAVNANAVEQAGMGVTSADLDGDGRLDIFVTNFSHDTNTLYLNAGEPGNFWFDDRTAATGLGGEASYTFLSWGTGIHDFDLDGRLDVFVASGHVYPQADRARDIGTTYRQRNQLFMGLPKRLSFEDRAPEAGPGLAIERVSRSTSFGDLDLDGRIDVLITNIDDWPTLLMNECRPAGCWLGLRIESGDPRNRDGVGAKVFLELSDGRVLRRDVLGGGGYLASNAPFLHFGLGASEAKSLRIVWPDGEEATYGVPALDSYWVLRRGGETLERPPQGSNRR